jgi:integrase
LLQAAFRGDVVPKGSAEDFQILASKEYGDYPSLKHKRVTVHRLRHTMAMDLLQAGVDRSVIALWLGHEHVETTQIHLEATLAMKEKALAKTSPPDGTPGRYKPGDRLLAFLNSL